MTSLIAATSRASSPPCIPKVIWANGMEGGHVHGRDEVRSYWKRQWAILNPHVEPVEISSNCEGEVVVTVHQVVRVMGAELVGANV